MKGFKSTSTNPYTYTQDGVWKKGQYTFQAVVKSDSGYAIAFQKPDLSWDVIDLSWQVQAGQYCSVLEAGFTLEYDAVAFKLIANDVTGEVVVLSPMLEQGTNPSTPIAHEEDLRGMDGDNHEFIFTRNDTGIAPDAPLSTQDDDYVPEDWTDNPQGVTKELPFEFVSMREKKVGVWLDFSPPSLWAKWSEDGLSVYLRKQGHYETRWVGTEKVTDIVGGEMFGETELIKVTAVFRKGEEDVAPTESLSRGFQWYVNGVHLPAFDDQHYITLDNTYGDGFADIVKLSYIVNSLREEIEVEVMNISAGMDGIGEEFIFKSNDSDTTPPVLPQTTDANYQDDDYYGQGTANEWNDDPVAPTELNQFVWVAKRKKVGGVWEAFGTPSLWTWWVTDGGDAAYWELRSSAPLIYKDAEDASTSGVHTTITLSGRYVEGVSSQNGGYISAQPNGGVEDTPLISPREFTPPNNAGVDGYVFRLYDDASKTTLLDTLTVPVAFKGEKGVSAINITLSNEADTLPATEDGVVTDYTGSGTTIRVFEGSQDLSYGTGNGQYQVSASGSNISPDSTPSTNGNARVYGDASSMGSAATAVITFAVIGKTFGGVSFSFDKVQNFTKSERGDIGEDGAGILSVTDWYAISTNGTTAPGTGWQTTMPSKPANYYLWNYEVITYTDGRTPTQTEKRVIQGKDARSIYDIKNAYAYSASDTVSPISGWQYSIAALGTKPAGYYLWVREDIAYTDNPSNYIGTIGYVVRDGEPGEPGEPGKPGDDGKGVSSVVIWYYKSSSATTQTGGSWSTTKPDYSASFYLWTKVITTYTDNSASETVPVLDPDWHKVRAITDKFGVTINGGLISAVIVELREADSLEVTAGHSGIQGANKDLPAYWAGGTYAEALSGTAKAIIRHDGTVKFTSAEITGTVNAISGTFNNVIFQSGHIGGFRVSGTGLTNGPDFNNDAYIIFRNDANKTFAGIGGNVLPSSSGLIAVARFENGATNNFYGSTNYGVIIEASGALRNIGISLVGDIVMKGSLVSIEPTFQSIGYTDSIILNISKYRRFLFTPGTSQYLSVDLPSSSQIVDAFGSDKLPTYWNIEIEIEVAWNASGSIALRGSSGGIFVNNNGDVVNHEDTYTYGIIKMKKGDVATVRYNSYHGRWQLINHNY